MISIKLLHKRNTLLIEQTWSIYSQRSLTQTVKCIFVRNEYVCTYIRTYSHNFSFATKRFTFESITIGSL
ncbi:hypothetical protein PUN28_013014 [Cardiocondyla obscurior]|uniref:Uncharacterized protein n=1 Tax=Cardiocondyla obscurior TaxID=286306 RepID=A0AAW2F667_9HYME